MTTKQTTTKQTKQTRATKTTKAPAKKTQATKATKANGSQPPAKAKAAAKTKKYGRNEALLDALRQGGTRQEIAEACDKLYVKHGGKASASGARTMVDIYVPMLKLVGVVTEDKACRLSLNQ